MKEACAYLYIRMVCFLKSFQTEERGAVDIVAIVVMIGIAVALAVLFRTQIQGLLETLFAAIQGNATQAVS